MHGTVDVLLRLHEYTHTKLAPGWAFIKIHFDRKLGEK